MGIRRYLTFALGKDHLEWVGLKHCHATANASLGEGSFSNTLTQRTDGHVRTMSALVYLDRPQWCILGLRMGKGGGDKFQSQLRASGFKLQTVEVAVRFKMNALPIMLLLSIHVHAVYWSNKQCGYVSIPSISGLTTSGP